MANSVPITLFRPKAVDVCVIVNVADARRVLCVLCG
jgi:hypothetical protein